MSMRYTMNANYGRTSGRASCRSSKALRCHRSIHGIGRMGYNSKMDDRIPAKLASSFARTTGIDRDDLLQEARIAYWWADACGKYDPHHAAFSTYATHCVTRRLCDVVRASHRQPRYED